MKTLPKYHMQNIKFSSVEGCFEYLSVEEYKFVKPFRMLIFDCIFEIRECLSFNASFHKQKNDICFLWPSSVLWEK